MLDKNGKEIKTGMIVEVFGAYFKSDNGTYFVEHSGGDPNWLGTDHCLKKIGKSGKISTALRTLCFWPISIHTTDRKKRVEGNAWNKKHAEIEIINTIPHKEVADYFQKKGDDMYPLLKREMWDWGEDHPSYLKDKKIQDFYFEKASEIRSGITEGILK